MDTSAPQGTEPFPLTQKQEWALVIKQAWNVSSLLLFPSKSTWNSNCLRNSTSLQWHSKALPLPQINELCLTCSADEMQGYISSVKCLLFCRVYSRKWSRRQGHFRHKSYCKANSNEVAVGIILFLLYQLSSSSHVQKLFSGNLINSFHVKELIGRKVSAQEASPTIQL